MFIGKTLSLKIRKSLFAIISQDMKMELLQVGQRLEKLIIKKEQLS